MTDVATPPEVPFDLASPVEPWVVVAADDDGVVRERVSELMSLGIVRHLDSTKMVDEAGLFSEFADKLQFPSYFGHNWYALVDCLDDLHGSWHGERAVVIIVEGAELLVNKNFFPLFVALLCEAAERANLSLDADGLPRGRSPFPLHFVFFVGGCDLRVLADMLRTRNDIYIHEWGDRLLISSQRE